MGTRSAWKIWRGKHLVRDRISLQTQAIGALHRDRFPGIAEDGALSDALIGLLAVLAEDMAEEGPTAGELGYLMDCALGRAVPACVIEQTLQACTSHVWRMEMGREAYYVLEPAGCDRAAGLARRKAGDDDTAAWIPAPHMRRRIAI